jgi:hypothetical protein
MAKMSTREIQAMLGSEKAAALAAISAAQLMEERADAMDYYLGNMERDMPAQDGRSRAVSTDVSDIIEGLLPGLMDIFAGSDEVMRFEPVGPEDEEATGIVKVWWDEREQEERETYFALSEDQYAALAYAVQMSDGAMKIVEHTVNNEAESAAEDKGDVKPSDKPEAAY